MVNDKQVLLYRKKRAAGSSQEAAAAKSDMSANTARKWEDLPLPSVAGTPRDWRTRRDPLGEVWESMVVPLLRSDDGEKLQSTTILEELKAKDGAKYGDGLLRTIQRRLRDWRAVNGKGKEVFFEQEHPPGREGQFDFTHAEELRVTILGQPFPHMFFQLFLSCSGWRFAELCYGETFEALVRGVQNGLWDLGGLVKVLRSDNLSAATQELRHEAQRKPTKRFQKVLDHFGMVYTRIRAGKSNENGAVENGNKVFKDALEQRLIVRVSRDFPSIESYAAFAEEVRERLNARVELAYLEELKHLRPLPSARIPAHSDVEVSVRKWSTIRVRENTYSVSSNLRGHRVIARVHPDIIEVLYKGSVVESFPRLRGRSQRRIDYRHVIHSLVRKPGAFARWKYREDMFPTLTFRLAYDSLRHTRGERADVEYLRLLELAATTMESRVEAVLQHFLDEGRALDCTEIRRLVETTPDRPLIVEVAPVVADLVSFDSLLTGECIARCERQQDEFAIAV